MIARLDNLQAAKEAKDDPLSRAAQPPHAAPGPPPARTSRSSRTAADALPPVPPARSAAAALIAQWFGLPVHEKPARAPRLRLWERLPLPFPGQIMLITGPSGAGKSSLLRSLARRGGANVIHINRIGLKRLPCVDQFGGDIKLALDLLNRVGLAEAFTYMQLPRELSDGQRWRLRLALGLAQAMNTAPGLLVADEFCAVLDRVTAAVVASSLRRTIDRLRATAASVSAVLATSHDDLEPALLPDVVVRCDFGEVKVEESGASAYRNGA